MPNKQFIAHVLGKADEIKNGLKTRSWFSSAKLSAASDAFIKDLESAGVIWENVEIHPAQLNRNIPAHLNHNTSENRLAVVHALFKFCISQTDASDTLAYQTIVSELTGLVKSVSYTIEGDKETFFNKLITVFKATPLFITDPIQFINNIHALLSVFFNEIKTIKLLQEAGSHFIQYLHPHIQIDKENPLLVNTNIQQILQNNPSLGQELMAHLSKRAFESYDKDFFCNVNSNNFFSNWIALLQINGINADATIKHQNYTGYFNHKELPFVNFIQCWQLFITNKYYWSSTKVSVTASSMVASISAQFSENESSLPLPDVLDRDDDPHYLDINITIMLAYAISELFKQKAFNDLPSQTKAHILSLPIDAKKTPLQILALRYGEFGIDTITERLIIKLLKEGVSLEYETHPYWIEILLPKMKDPKRWQAILDVIPKEMLHIFYDKKLHLQLARELSVRLQQQDFWTQSLEEKLAPENTVCLEAVKKIVASKESKNIPIPEVEQIILDIFDKNIIALKAAQEIIPDPSMAQFLSPAIEQRSTDLRFSITEPHVRYKKQLALFSNHPKNDDAHDFIVAHHICNEVYYQVNLAINLNCELPHLSFDKIVHHFSIDEYYKKEIQISIYQSLVFFAREFKFHQNTDLMIARFHMLNRNIAAVLEVHHLSFKEIVLGNLESKALLKNMYVNMSLFDSKQILLQTELYKTIQNDADLTALAAQQIQSPHKDTTIFSTTLIAKATLYKQGIDFYKFGNTINQEYVNRLLDIEASDGLDIPTDGLELDGDAPEKMLLALKLMLVLIDYRIFSYTELKFEKSFYRDHLKQMLENCQTINMKNDFKAYKPYLIAQINASLKKLSAQNFADRAAKASLKELIDTLTTGFEIKISELDENAQHIFIEISYFCPENITQTHEEKIFFKHLIKEYCIDKKAPTVDDATQFVSFYAQGKYYNVYDATKLDYMKALLQVKNDSYNAVNDYLTQLPKEHGYKTYFYLKWILLLDHQCTEQIELNGKPLAAYIGINEVEVVIDICKNIYADLKTKIISTPFQRETQINVPLHKLKDGDGQTFNPSIWCDFYTTGKIPSASFTPLQQLAQNFLVSLPENAHAILEKIVVLLKNEPDIGLEDNTHGYWIEILLAGMHNKNSQEKDFFLKEILPIIPDDLMCKVLEENIRKKVMTNLKTQIDPFADAVAESDTYQLYLMLLLHAIVRYAAGAHTMPNFIKNVCNLLVLCKNQSIPQLYFITQYQQLPTELKNVFIEKIPEAIAENPLMPHEGKRALLNIIGDTTTLITVPSIQTIFLPRICVKVRDLLFSPVSTFSAQGANDYSHSVFFADLKNLIFSDKDKAALYGSIQKSIAYTFLYGQGKWRSYDYMIGVLVLLDELATTLHLDRNQMLPKERQVLIDHYIWLTQYKGKDTDKGLAILPNAFKNFTMAIAPVQNIDAFMTTIIAQASVYKNNFKNAIKYDNKENMNCAKLIAALPYENQNDDIKTVSFIKAIIAIIHYRIAGYRDITFDKGFYRNHLKASFETLIRVPLQLSDFHKQQLFYEIEEALYALSQSHRSVFQMHVYQQSLNESLMTFIVAFGLQKQFEGFESPHFYYSDSHDNAITVAAKNAESTGIIVNSKDGQSATTGHNNDDGSNDSNHNNNMNVNKNAKTLD